MKTIVINGLSLCWAKSMTGIQRSCRELIYRLDALLENEKQLKIKYVFKEEDLNIIIKPKELKNIIPVPFKETGKFCGLSKLVKAENGMLCNLSLETAFIKNQLSFIYDLRPVIEKFDSFKFRLKYRIYLCIQKHLCKYFLTDSDYQKELIKKYLKKNENQITTIYMGWEHIERVEEDMSIFERFPKLVKGQFYYSLGSLAPHKNFRWILEVAKRNPNTIFAIAGGKNLAVWKDNVESDEMRNVIFLGYVTDEESKALMKNCKAFLHPSKFEGFGIPPLEALACGASIIISNATCLPEIYEDCAHYFDPDDYDVNLEKLLEEPVAGSQKILDKCSWDKSAKILFDILKDAASAKSEINESNV